MQHKDKNRNFACYMSKCLLCCRCFIHDMAITEHYSLLFDMPVTFSLERVMEVAAVSRSPALG